MFTLNYAPGKLKQADNLLPIGQVEMESRPGAQQVISGNINTALGWGNSVVFERYGQLMIWHVIENTFTDRTAGTRMTGTSFQALTGYGDRQRRLYIASGDTVFYIYRRPNGEGDTQLYESVSIVNECQDDQQQPYNLPKAKVLATWRNRLWASDGTHIVYHTENDKPHYWDPINAMQVQSGNQSDVTALASHGDRLMIATPDSLWQVTGDSKYNFSLTKVVSGHGAVGSRAMVSDGRRLFYLDRQGVYELGRDEPLSGDIDSVFYTPDSGAELLLDNQLELLFLLYGGRLFTWHTRYQRWGEIITDAKGLVRIGNRVGWYGVDGLWLLNTRYSQDTRLDGSKTPVRSVMRTWQEQPNIAGVTDLQRVYVGAEGNYLSHGCYRLYTDADQAALMEAGFDIWRHEPRYLTIGGVNLYHEKPEYLNVEIPVQLADYQFEHELLTDGYIRLRLFDPRYNYPARDE